MRVVSLVRFTFTIFGDVTFWTKARQALYMISEGNRLGLRVLRCWEVMMLSLEAGEGTRTTHGEVLCVERGGSAGGR
jgi:hypothetical protein